MLASLLVLLPRAEAVNGTLGGSCFSEGSIEVFCLDKTASPNPATVGQPLIFTVTFTNVSGNPVIFLGGFDVITDPLPPGVTFVSATTNQPGVTCEESGGTVTCSGGSFTLQNGESLVATIVVTPTQCGGPFTNTASFPEGLTASATFTVVGCEGPAAPSAAALTCPPASQEFSERRIQSGAASPSTGISNAGNNANLSPTSQQTANTGNVANEQGVVQSCSTPGDVDLSGSSLTLSPSTTSESTQTIDQAAAS